jgi:cobalt/nickel transport system permease protein
MNLTPLIGILVGPSIGSLIVLMVNILSAVIGHGGGANRSKHPCKRQRGRERVLPILLATRRFELFTRGAVAAFGGLLVGNILSVLIIVISGIQGGALLGSALPVFTLQVPLLNLVVAVGEAILSGFVVEYLGKVRPSGGYLIRRDGDLSLDSYADRHA